MEMESSQSIIVGEESDNGGVGPPSENDDNYWGTTLTEADSTIKKELCMDCKKLNLTAEKFIVEDTSISSMMRQQDLSSKMDSRSSRLSPKSRNTKQCLGTLQEIMSKSQTCPFCKLVRNSLKLSKHGAHLDAKCDMTWELDGREVDGRHGSLKARTRRIHLRWDDENMRHAYLVFVAPERYLRFSSDVSGAWERRAFFLGRNIESSSNIFLMKSWLDQCSREHGGECNIPQDSEFNEMAGQSFFGVIDVLDMCLKPLPRQGNDRVAADATRYYIGDSYEPYIALSYVWGTVDPYTTKLANILTHKIPGSLAKYLADLPQVVRDAMALVTQLGHRYLWVDSLCIVQDSSRSWKLNADVMNLIYGNAFMTICAADGNDSRTGLKAMHPEQRSASQHIEECAPGVSLMLREFPEVGISSSMWNTRAWTFQERLLSRRCLIFAEGRVFFQCRRNAMSEDLVAVKNGAGWSLDLVQALPQILRELPRRGFRVYMNCVDLYSSRALTKPKDILSAFKGVSNLIADNMGTPFVFGLPCSHFDLAILWVPLRTMRRRKPRTVEEKKNPDEMAFPSWSWCGWENSRMQYKNEMVEDCLTSVQEWLLAHTWISWYIRDGRGNLRPLWLRQESRGSKDTEERWKGYKSDLGSNNDDRSLLLRRDNGPVDESEEGNDRVPGGIHINNYIDNYIYDEPSRRLEVRPRRPSYSAVERRPSRFAIERNGYQSTESYGRSHPCVARELPRDGFRETLPESPYKVLINRDPEPDTEFPDQPYLQFFTWMTSLHLDPRETTNEKLGEGLCRCDIADNNGDWCGSIVLEEAWITAKGDSERGLEDSRFNFIAISDAKAFTPEECEVWTYYTPKERSQSEWDLYYVLLVERRDPIWYRVGLGKVFRDAFPQADSDWREIVFG